MTIKVIGAGLPRSGTNSLCDALEILGYPTHHMRTVAQSAKAGKLWHEYLVEKKPPDWEAIFAGYDAVCDGPACFDWEAILAAYPDAKVVLTVRSADGWAKSYTTLQGFVTDRLPWIFGPLGAIGFTKFSRFLEVAAANKQHFLEHKMKGKSKDLPVPRSVSDVPTPPLPELEQIYHTWVADVKKRCPASKLLVFDVRDGWAPLCAFLEKPVPAQSFPNTNAGMSGLQEVAIQSTIIKPLKETLSAYGAPIACAAGAILVLLIASTR